LFFANNYPQPESSKTGFFLGLSTLSTKLVDNCTEIIRFNLKITMDDFVDKYI